MQIFNIEELPIRWVRKSNAGKFETSILKVMGNHRKRANAHLFIYIPPPHAGCDIRLTFKKVIHHYVVLLARISLTSLATHLYHPLLSADPPDYILYQHGAVVDMFLLVVQPLLVHVRASTKAHRFKRMSSILLCVKHWLNGWNTEFSFCYTCCHIKVWLFTHS